MKTVFKIFTSALGISRWKNKEQSNDCGVKAASNYEGMQYWIYNWSKDGGAARMREIAKNENFYKQEYCGCIYSLSHTNLWREKNGRNKIVICENFYQYDTIAV